MAQESEIADDLDLDFEHTWWRKFVASTADSSLALSARNLCQYDITNKQHSFCNSLIIDTKDVKILYTGKQYEGAALYNFGLSARIEKPLSIKLILGNYRAQFGKGLISGFSQTAARDGVISIKQSNSPLLYTPNGIASNIELGHHNISATYSRQHRIASLKDNHITYLNKYKTDKLGKTAETIHSFSYGFKHDLLRLGICYYDQNYQAAFSETHTQVPEQAIGFYTSFDLGKMALEQETDFTSEAVMGSYSTKYALGHFTNQISFRFATGTQFLPYSRNPFLLSGYGANRELDWLLKYAFTKHISSSVDITVNKDTQNLKVGKQVSRIWWDFAFKDRTTTARIKLKGLDRDILVLSDSLFIETIPLHYRVELEASHNLGRWSKFSYRMRYNIEEKSSYSKNSTYWDMIYSFRKKGNSIRVGLVNWNTNKRISLSNSGILNQQFFLGTDTRLKLDLQRNWEKMKLILSYEQSLRNSSICQVDFECSLAI